MKTLIIYTYPNHKSLNYAFLQEVLKGCQENPAIEEIQILDLYEEEFDPRLIFHEHKRRRDMYQDPKLEKYRQQLSGRISLYLFINLVGKTASNVVRLY